MNHQLPGSPPSHQAMLRENTSGHHAHVLSPDPEYSVRISGLTRIFKSGKHRVEANVDISVDIRRGEIFALLGRNGAGKTTFVHQMLGLVKPTSGQISVEGIDAIAAPERVKAISGFLPQKAMPLQSVDVIRALEYTGRLRGQNARDARQQAHDLLDDLDLMEYQHRLVSTLSGGILRLTNFAMALMGNPQIVILDEPTNELDPRRRRVVWNKIGTLNKQNGLTCILVTHHILDAETVLHRVGIMQNGRMIAVGTPPELKDSLGLQHRLEFQMKDDDCLSSEQQSMFRHLGTLVEKDEKNQGGFILHLSPERVPQAMDILFNQIGQNRLQHQRLDRPSLEDAYLQLDEAETD